MRVDPLARPQASTQRRADNVTRLNLEMHLLRPAWGVLNISSPGSVQLRVHAWSITEDADEVMHLSGV